MAPCSASPPSAETGTTRRATEAWIQSDPIRGAPRWVSSALPDKPAHPRSIRRMGKEYALARGHDNHSDLVPSLTPPGTVACAIGSNSASARGFARHPPRLRARSLESPQPPRRGSCGESRGSMADRLAFAARVGATGRCPRFADLYRHRIAVPGDVMVFDLAVAAAPPAVWTAQVLFAWPMRRIAAKEPRDHRPRSQQRSRPKRRCGTRSARPQ